MSIYNFKNKTQEPIKNSNKIGIKNKPKKYNLRILSLIVLSHILVFIMGTADNSKEEKLFRLPPQYSESLVKLQLKTPFESGKKICLQNNTGQVFNEIFLIKKEESRIDHFSIDQYDYYVVAVPNHLLADIASSNKLTALSEQTQIIKQIAKKRIQYEINY